VVETVGIRQVMWFVMLESAKDRIIGVDTPGQQVPCSEEQEIGVVTRLGSHGARGAMVS
jgi:hypothetical protein